MVSLSTAHNRLACCEKVDGVDCCSKRPAAIQPINQTAKKLKTDATMYGTRSMNWPSGHRAMCASSMTARDTTETITGARY